MPSPLPVTYYQRLGVPPWASDEVIRLAYRRLSKRYHPDTSPLPPEDAIRCFHEIQEAYRVLSNPSQRGLYDSTLWLQDPQAWRRDYHRDPQPTPEDVALGKPALQWEMQTRPLSGAELFALLSMGLVFVACLLLVGGIAWLRESNVG